MNQTNNGPNEETNSPLQPPKGGGKVSNSNPPSISGTISGLLPENELPPRAEDSIFNRYNELAKLLGFPVARTLTTSRRNRIRLRLEDYPEHSFWVDMFHRLEESPQYALPENDWFDFDWLIKSGENLERIARGRGKWKTKSSQASPPPGSAPAQDIFAQRIKEGSVFDLDGNQVKGG